MKNENQNHRGFVTALPPLPLSTKTRCLFTGTDETGKEVSIYFTPLRTPGKVSPEELHADITASDGSLPGKLTLFAPTFDLGKFRYRRPGTKTDTETEATDVRSLAPTMPGPAPLAPTTEPPPTPPRRPEPARSSRGMDMDF